jgi:hypothetical protein
MKHLTKFLFAVAALTVGMSSCDDSGNTDKDKTLILYVDNDKTTILGNGEDAVTFTATYNGRDVTDRAYFYANDEEITYGNRFYTDKGGQYTIIAKFNNVTSNAVVITAKSNSSLRLSIDKAILKNDGSESATFTVTQDGLNVTDQIEICSNTLSTCLTGNVYTPTQEQTGTQDFYAYFLSEANNPYKLVSNTAQVIVTEGETEVNFQKNVAIFNRTGTWCSWCGVFKPVLSQLQENMGDKVTIVCVYSENSQTPLAIGHDTGITLWNQLMSSGSVPSGGGIPSTVFDMRTLVGGHREYTAVLPIYNSLAANAAKTGISVKSTINGGKINVSAGIIAETEGEYAIGALLVEDNIVYYQNQAGSQYNHTNVLRAKAMDNIFGDELGVINAGGSVGKTFDFDVDSRYVAENLSVVIYTTYVETNGKKHIANIVKCPANGSVDYKFAE